MKKVRGITIAPSLKDALDKCPINNSAAIAQAVMNAHADDGLLIRALKRRLALPSTEEENSIRITYTQDIRVTQLEKELVDRARLAAEPLVRLALEAYIYRL